MLMLCKSSYARLTPEVLQDGTAILFRNYAIHFNRKNNRTKKWRASLELCVLTKLPSEETKGMQYILASEEIMEISFRKGMQYIFPNDQSCAVW